MATVNLTTSFYSEYFWGAGNASVISKSGTAFEFSTATFLGTFYVRVTGTGLTYSGDDPLAGNYTAITAYSDAGFTTQVANYSSATNVDFGGFFDTSNGGGSIAALVGADSLTGSSQSDFFAGRGGADTLDGLGGSDQYIYLSDELNAGEVINDTGGSGTDELVVADTSVDFRVAATIAGIELLSFNVNGGTAIFDGSQFSGGQLPANLEVNGDPGLAQTIVVVNATSFSAAGWTFSNWDAIDILKIAGTTGNDTIIGSSQRDALTGGRGKDVLTGGTGKDTFDFNSIKESLKGSHRDRITDFSHTDGDKIDLLTIDASTHRGGNQAFKFIGSHAFSHHDGELRYSGHVVQGDINGDGKADFEIHVNLGSLTKGDFIL